MFIWIHNTWGPIAIQTSYSTQKSYSTQLFNINIFYVVRFGVFTAMVIVSIYTIHGTDTPYIFTLTACFSLMWPSSGTLGLTITYFFSCYSPYTNQCLHIGSALYVWFYVMPYVLKRTKYWTFKILNHPQVVSLTTQQWANHTMAQ
jgi:hypothetical protein